MEETKPSTGFDPEDKPKNLKVIKGHFDKLELYSFYDITILQEEKELDLEKINYGIVAGFAVWSGYSFSNSVWSILLLQFEKVRVIIANIKNLFFVKICCNGLGYC